MSRFNSGQPFVGANPKGLPGAPERALVSLFFEKDEFVMDLKGFTSTMEAVRKTYRIPTERLLTADVVTDNLFVEKNKSVIGRGIVGGLLFGPAGVLLGGLSGLGTKQVLGGSDIPLIIAYANKEGEIQNIIFGVAAHKMNELRNFISEFQQIAPPLELDDANVETNENGDVLL